MNMPGDEIPVSSDRPESPIHVQGTDHITVTGSNVKDTVQFYRDTLGMALVLRQPNLDQPEVTHLFFDTGDGRILTFFVSEDRPSNSRPAMDIGNVHHLAFSIPANELNEIKAALKENGHRFNEFDRGAFHSLYTSDNNGLTIELVVDKWELPDDRRGDVLALAHEKRVAAGAEYVDDEHVEAALNELELEVNRNEIPEAPTGTGIRK